MSTLYPGGSILGRFFIFLLILFCSGPEKNLMTFYFSIYGFFLKRDIISFNYPNNLYYIADKIYYTAHQAPRKENAH